MIEKRIDIFLVCHDSRMSSSNIEQETKLTMMNGITRSCYGVKEEDQIYRQFDYIPYTTFMMFSVCS